MNQFEEYQAFVAVVELQSFTAASARLKTTKSVLSRRVSMLEERIGVQLLHRTTRAMRLTDSGREFFDHCQRLLQDLAEGESTLSEQQEALRGNLRIALPLSFGVRHMCAPIATFKKQHPELQFDLDLSDRNVDLVQQNFDMALRIGELADSTLQARRLFEVRMLVCASPAYLRQRGVPEMPEDIHDHDCLGYAQSSTPKDWIYRSGAGPQRRLKVKSAMVASSGDFLSNAAAHGQGIVLLPTFIVADNIRTGKLQPVLTDYDWPGLAAYAVYPPTRYLSHRVRSFIDFLSEKFAGTPQWDRDCGL